MNQYTIKQLTDILYDYVYKGNRSKYDRTSVTIAHAMNMDNVRISHTDPRVSVYLDEIFKNAKHMGRIGQYHVYDGKKIRIHVAPLNDKSHNNSKIAYLLSDLVIYGKTSNILLPICQMDVPAKRLLKYVKGMDASMYRVCVTERFKELKLVREIINDRNRDVIVRQVRDTLNTIRRDHPGFVHGNLTSDMVYYDGESIKLYFFDRSTVDGQGDDDIKTFIESLAHKNNIFNNNIMDSTSYELYSASDNKRNTIKGTRRLPTSKSLKHIVKEARSKKHTTKHTTKRETPPKTIDSDDDSDSEEKNKDFQSPDDLDDIPTTTDSDDEMTPVAKPSKKKYEETPDDLDAISSEMPGKKTLMDDESEDDMKMNKTKSSKQPLKINRIGQALGVTHNDLTKMASNAKPGPPSYDDMGMGMSRTNMPMNPSFPGYGQSMGMPASMPAEFANSMPMNGMSFNSMSMPMSGMPMGGMPQGMSMGDMPMGGMQGMPMGGMNGMPMGGMQGMPMGGMQGMPGMMPPEMGGMSGMMPQMMGGRNFFFNK
jgi:hypothetical protein